MRYALFLMALGAGLGWGQTRPQMTWDGYVMDGAVLYIQGDRVDAQGRSTGSVDRPRYEFVSALPPVQQQVEVRVRRGRGRVQVIEQPSPGNEFTAVVRIDPVNRRGETYSLDFYWDAGRGVRSSRRADDRWETRGRRGDVNTGAGGEMTWTGNVDNEVLVVVNARRAVARTVRGQQAYGDRAEFTSPMPRGAVVQLVDAQGRGRVELIEQPSAQNRWAAVVRITDPDSGAGQYAFRLAWGSESGSMSGYPSSGGGVLTPGGSSSDWPSTQGPSYGSSGAGSMRWSGTVDGLVRVTIRGSQAFTTRVSGAPVRGERAEFSTALPRMEVRDVDIRRVEGRDEVRIVERPSAANGYSLVFEIDDNDGGADNYVVEVSWR